MLTQPADSEDRRHPKIRMQYLNQYSYIVYWQKFLTWSAKLLPSLLPSVPLQKSYKSIWAHPSHKLKWAFLNKICPLSVVVVAIVVIVNFSHFSLTVFNPERLCQFQPNICYKAVFDKGMPFFIKFRALYLSGRNNNEKGRFTKSSSPEQSG